MRVQHLALSSPEECDVYADTEADDHAVIAASMERPEAFGELFERHARELHRFLSRRLGELADDLLGELFVTAFERRATYRAELPDARPWLYGIASNLIHRHHRAEATHYRAHSRAHSRVPLAVVAPDSASAAVASADAATIRPRLAAALASLKAADRDVLLLLAWGQLDQGEAATALGIPVGTVRSRVHRARQQLRPILDDLQGELR